MSQKRSDFFTFLNIATTTPKESPTWALIGDGVTEMSISYNPQTNTEQFIHEDVAHTTVTGYQPNSAITAQCVKGDKVFDYIDEKVRRTMAIGDATKTEICMVYLYMEKKTNGYPCERIPVTLQVDSYGGAASDPLSIGYTINFDGMPEAGYFDPSGLEFKAEAGE